MDRAVDRLAAGSAGNGPHTARILIAVRRRGDRSASEYAKRPDREGVGAGDLIELQDIDSAISGQRRRIDDEEESSGLVIEVSRLSIERLAGYGADRIEAILDDVAFLLGQDAAELDGTELRDRLDAEVVGGNRRGNESRRRRRERDVPGFHPPQDFVFQTFVPHVQVVVCVEFPLAVEVDIDVQTLADDTAGTYRILRIRTDCRKSAAATRDRELTLL